MSYDFLFSIDLSALRFCVCCCKHNYLLTSLLAYLLTYLITYLVACLLTYSRHRAESLRS